MRDWRFSSGVDSGFHSQKPPPKKRREGRRKRKRDEGRRGGKRDWSEVLVRSVTPGKGSLSFVREWTLWRGFQEDPSQQWKRKWLAARCDIMAEEGKMSGLTAGLLSCELHV